MSAFQINVESVFELTDCFTSEVFHSQHQDEVMIIVREPTCLCRVGVDYCQRTDLFVSVNPLDQASDPRNVGGETSLLARKQPHGQNLCLSCGEQSLLSSGICTWHRIGSNVQNLGTVDMTFNLYN
ncbi:hypothetical protein RRG08_024142 [Elysia crispata]|uniref:Uncharacterized protein n=1 Tax=Elysia crispata TaxID=231223 RepID=A0AAE0YQG0_9GAST|nr:hypothetical protein RRG08_024142 [Elysia crispata]